MGSVSIAAQLSKVLSSKVFLGMHKSVHLTCNQGLRRDPGNYIDRQIDLSVCR